MESTFSSWNWLGSQIACCFYLTGVIWVIQLIHYPAFSAIEEKAFAMFHSRHTAAMGVIVGPVMFFELMTALVLCFQFQIAWVINLLSVLMLWSITFFISVPSHNKLAKGRDPLEIRKLVRCNWLRTWIWTLRSMVFLAMILKSKIIF